MSQVIKRTLAAAAVLTFLLPIHAEAENATAMRAAAAEPMSQEQIWQIYRDRSWVWKDGAGYFRNRERAFMAATNGSDGRTIANGRWFLPGRGRLCFRALWQTRTGAANALTCFEHRQDANGRIYQRRIPDGEWITFYSGSPRKYDEIRKVRSGDRVSPSYNRYKQSFDPQG